MACPTCDHTMVNLGTIPTGFWCERCGTIKTDDVVGASVPKLVERMRHVIAQAKNDAHTYPEAKSFLDVYHRLGITESIHRPEDRP